MNKIRLIFILAVTIITVIGLLFFHAFRAPLNPEISKTTDLKITLISGNGKISYSTSPIDMSSSSNVKTLDIRQMQTPPDSYFKCDSHTAFECWSSGVSYCISPNSYVFIQSSENKLTLFEGELFWNKIEKNKKAMILIHDAGGPSADKLELSESGRIRVKNGAIEVWNYSGGAHMNYKGQDFPMNSNQMFANSVPGQPNTPGLWSILPSPQNPDPILKEVVLQNPNDASIRFNWNSVSDSSYYIFRIYNSVLRENMLMEQILDINRFNVDLLQYADRTFYWEVYSYDNINKKEGAPSKMGQIRFSGNIMDDASFQKSPSLSIESCASNGNLVITYGTADPDSKLYINGEESTIDSDGKFNKTIKYHKMGTFKVIFKLISPFKVETVIEREVSILSLDDADENNK